MEIKNKIRNAAIVGAVLTLLPAIAFADFATIISTIADQFTSAAWDVGYALITIGIIWTGITFLTAGGEPEKIKKARTMLVWVIVGGAIILGFDAITGIMSSLIK